jgi:type II secretory pathway component PulF
MALYAYQALTKDGKKVTGNIDAPSIAGVREQLGKQGLFPVKITLAQEGGSLSWWRKLLEAKVTTKEKILFTKQLAVLLKSGVPLLQSLELLIDQFTGKLHGILVSLKDEIKEGQSLANGLKKYPAVFDNIYVQLVRAGEASGKLETILERLTVYMERKEALRKRIADAMRGPIINLVFSCIVIVVLLVYIVPTMAETFASQQKELPGPTKFMLNLSGFLSSYWWLVAILGVLAYMGFNAWKKTPAGGRKIDTFKLKLPIVNFFARTSAVVQFCQTLGMLEEGGVNLAESLDIVCKIIDNRILADTLNQARDKIIKQGKIAQYLKQTGIFPPIATYLIQTGEQSGQLGFMLLTVAQNYEQELGERADQLAGLINPIMLFVMAVITGFIVLSIALPMFQMGQVAGL